MLKDHSSNEAQLRFRLPAGVILAAAWLVFAFFFLRGAVSVPFHPDESTQLYMSSELEVMFSNPLSMKYRPELGDDPRQNYRLLDAPLTRLSIGIARQLAGGLPALPLDWDWALNWEENLVAGALPSPGLLRVGRYAASCLALLALIFLYQAGKRLGGWWTGLLAAGLLAINALYLLHARRAMAEGPLLFGVTLAMWGFLEGERRPWLAGLGAALAFSAKQSALVLAPVGLLAVVWLVDAPLADGWRTRAKNLLQYLVVFGLIILALNPWLWGKPEEAFQAALEARNHLLALQVADIARVYPYQVIDTAGERLLSLVNNLFLNPLAFAELGKYLNGTAASEMVYLNNPLHTLLRGRVGGAVMLFLCLSGMVLALVRLHRMRANRKRAVILMLLAGGAQLAGIIAAIPLAWQRYILPLLPFACLWIAYALRGPRDY